MNPQDKDLTRTQRRRLMTGVGAGALGALALSGAAVVAKASGQDDGTDVTGGWYITVQLLLPTPSTFDALYAFTAGGAFIRIDGRNNAPALGSWKTQGQDIIMTALLFSFDPATGNRLGTITGHFQATVTAGGMNGTFSATGVATDGLPLAGFPKSGTFTGTRIVAQAP
jgi:hypothetical protein